MKDARRRKGHNSRRNFFWNSWSQTERSLESAFLRSQKGNCGLSNQSEVLQFCLAFLCLPRFASEEVFRPLCLPQSAHQHHLWLWNARKMVSKTASILLSRVWLCEEIEWQIPPLLITKLNQHEQCYWKLEFVSAVVMIVQDEMRAQKLFPFFSKWNCVGNQVPMVQNF